MYITFILLALNLLFIKKVGLFNSLFIIMITLSGFYYAFFGALYWLYIENGYFAGFNWSNELVFTSQLFATYILITTFSYFMFIRKNEFSLNFTTASSFNIDKTVLSLYWIGILSCIYVYIDKDGRGALFLVAYQFSDLFIAAILVLAVINYKSKHYKYGLIFFIVYCLFVGFRYKLILVFFPLFIINLARSNDSVKIIKLVVFPLLLLILFSILTLVRVKFSGLDLNQLNQFDSQELLYGFFADANILFGLSSITTYVLPTQAYIYFQPLMDAIVDLIPRFIYPEKNTGSQISMVLMGLRTHEGINSATTYPFFGEYLMMGGYVFASVVCALLGVGIAKVVNFFSRYKNKELAWLSISLVAVLFGYYYVSRGYFPQFFKSILFILIPMFVMSIKYKNKERNLC